MVAQTLRVERTDISSDDLNNMPDTKLESMKVWLSKNATQPYDIEIAMKVTVDSADRAAFQAVWGGTQTTDV